MSSAAEALDSQRRTSAKGRRRRAAAEQRRIEQQRLGEYLCDVDENSAAPQPSSSLRRRNRRMTRRQAERDQIADVLEDDYYLPQHWGGDQALEFALALSLSIADRNPDGRNFAISEAEANLDLSYESLVQLEGVTCAAPLAVVNALKKFLFQAAASTSSESCVICQNEYADGEKLLSLPCKHNFHHTCGSQWLLNYSKLCPVCKVDVTE